MKNLITILLSLVSAIGITQIPSCPGEGFGGNKEVSISSITPKIHYPDSIGEAPFSVYVSAFQTTGSGSTEPYYDIEYSWDFGDNSTTGAGTIVHPVDGSTVSANTDQKGPEASYFYETPGVYEITLTARAWNGSAFISASTTKSVTITAWSGQDRYVDPSSGSDLNDGQTTSTAWQSWTQATTWLNNGNNRRVLFKRGETVDVTGTFTTKKSGIRMGAYGVGNKPILLLNNSAAGNRMINLNAHNANVVDHLYEDLELDGNNVSGAIMIAYVSPTGSAERMTIANCVLRNGSFEGLVITTGPGPKRSFLVWQSDFHANLTEKQSFVPADQPYVGVIGGHFDGGSGNAVLDHHMYINHCDHTIIRWVDFGVSVNRNFCLNMNAPSYNDDFEYSLIDGCNVTGTNNGIDFSNGNNDNTGHFSHAIVQNCGVHDLTIGSQGFGVFGYSIRDVLIRDNLFYNNPIADIYIIDVDVDYRVYRNKFFTPNSMPHDAIQISSGQQGYFFHNTFYNAANSNSTYVYGDVSSGFQFDYNTYWAPSLTQPFQPTNPWQSMDFGTWQGLGFDVNSTQADPGFPDPGNGDFGQMPLADFSIITSPLQADFTNLSSNNPPAWPITFDWDFGDNAGTSTAISPSYTYPTAGDYNITLAATNSCGTSVSIQLVSILGSSACLGDFNADNQINTADLLLFLGGIGCFAPCFYDLDNDGIANTGDLLLFLGIFGSPC